MRTSSFCYWFIQVYILTLLVFFVFFCRHLLPFPTPFFFFTYRALCSLIIFSYKIRRNKLGEWLLVWVLISPVNSCLSVCLSDYLGWIWYIHAMQKSIFWNLCGQRRPRSDCAFAQSDLGLRCLLTALLDRVVYLRWITKILIRLCGFLLIGSLLFPCTPKTHFFFGLAILGKS